MPAAEKIDLVSVDDYLAGEESSETKHEYIAGSVIVAQDRCEVTIFRRSEDWSAKVFRSPEETVPIRSSDFSLRLSGIYEGVRPAS